MALFERWRKRVTVSSAAPSPRQMQPPMTVLGGYQSLEVVGESFYQEHLWLLVGGYSRERVRHEITATLVPEPTNPHDVNAVQVFIEGGLVGYLCREDAAGYGPGVQRLIDACGGSVGLHGQIVGGGHREGRLGLLGVFLDHDPADFGIGHRRAADIGELRTGLSQAIATDLEDDSYDLSWRHDLSGSHEASDIAPLRALLEDERDPIDRHFMLSMLGRCLYKARSDDPAALDEFDAVCTQHDAEMAVIREALTEKFGAMPVIEMYRQAAIRCQKARDWPRMRHWARRGLEVYGDRAARPEAVEDLAKRVAYAEAKLAAPVARTAAADARSRREPASSGPVEVLVCVACGGDFERVRARGRKPHRCPDCRAA